jgi:23S rRNA (adenine2503-C2)-methyltransferase
MPKTTLLDLSREELAEFLTDPDEPSFRATQIWRGVYRDLASSYEEITTLPHAFRAELTETLPFDPLRPVDGQVSRDNRTRKTLFRLADGETIEAVLMLYEDRRTACLSTQVGCPIGCPFCATGQRGFVRDLSPGEIVAQGLFYARALAREGERLTNVVYMGMGEPFLNYEATIKSIRVLNDPEGFRLGARHFTISTAGIVPGIERLAAEDLQVNLAISLHAGNDRLRDELVPVNRRYPLDVLLNACRQYIERTHRRITFEIALSEGVNDSIERAKEVIERLSDLLCHVNLIPFNPVEGPLFFPSSRERIDAFAKTLEKAGIPVTVRLGRGIDIQAGCGQLRGSIKE